MRQDPTAHGCTPRERRRARGGARANRALWFALAAMVTASPASAQTIAREQTADQQVVHALGRLGYGPRPGDVERVRAMGVDRWIARQLEPSRIDDARADEVVARFPTLGATAAELYRAAPPPAQLLAAARRVGDSAAQAAARDSLRRTDAGRRSSAMVAELVAAKVGRAVVSERQLHEVMVDFWENHFNVFAGKNQLRYALPEFDRDAIRPHALGRFRDLLGAVAKSPAMLVYLDNARSVADSGRETTADRRRPRARRGAANRGRERAPRRARRARGLNENYARELLELHTLGVDGGYSQQDVIEVARALTGWTVRAPQLGGPSFAFDPAAHDAEPKTVLGARLPAGRGIEDGEQVLDLLAEHPSTARFIARKLAVRFVSDSPPPALVERAAATFTRSRGDIRETVRTIVTSPEFFSAASFRAKVKTPFEVVVSALRAMGAEPDPSPRTARIVARLGQPLFGHQAPDGWPEEGAPWLNTGAILGRINFGMALAGGQVPGVRVERWPEAARLATLSREEQVDGVVQAILGGAVSPDMRRVLVSGDHPMMDRARAATDSSGMDDGGTLPRAPRLTGLAQVVGLAIGSPEFQRR